MAIQADIYPLNIISFGRKREVEAICLLETRRHQVAIASARSCIYRVLAVRPKTVDRCTNTVHAVGMLLNDIRGKSANNEVFIIAMHICMHI